MILGTHEYIDKVATLHSCNADPVSLVRDHRVRQGLTRAGIVVYSFSGDLLYEPWEIYDEHGQPFTRFSDFWHHCQTMPFEPDVPLPPPKRLRALPNATLREYSEMQ